MQQDLQQTASTVSKLEEENTLLKQRSTQTAEVDVAEVDPLAAEQVGRGPGWLAAAGALNKGLAK